MIAGIDKNYVRSSKKKTLERLFCFFMEGIPVTRKGQWINPLVFFVYSRILKKKKKISIFKDNPVYIIGTGRSGTTILSKILSLHPQIAMLNEPKAIWSLANKNEDIIGSYNLSEKGRLIFDSNESRNNENEIISAIYDWVLKKTKRKFIVDKYPELVFRVPWVKHIFKKSKFIFIVRNGYETLNSIKKWSEMHVKLKDNTKHDWWGVNNRKWDAIRDEIILKDSRYAIFAENINEIESNQILMAAVEWISAMEYGLDLLKKYSNDIKVIHFDDLKKYNKNFIDSIIKFIDISDDRLLHNYSKYNLNYNEKEYSYSLPPYFEKYIDKINLNIEKFKYAKN